MGALRAKRINSSSAALRGSQSSSVLDQERRLTHWPISFGIPTLRYPQPSPT